MTPSVALARVTVNRACSDADTSIRVRAAVTPLPLPPAIGEAVERFLERAGSYQAVQTLERDLVRALQLDHVLVVWIDWVHRRAWTPSGSPSARLEDLAIEAAGTGRRLVLGNALIDPFGRAPARAVIAFKGAPERLFLPHTLRTIGRLTTRLGSAIDRLRP